MFLGSRQKERIFLPCGGYILNDLILPQSPGARDGGTSRLETSKFVNKTVMRRGSPYILNMPEDHAFTAL